METPPRMLTALRPIQSPCPVYTPTSIKVRVNLLSAISDAVEGDKADENFDPEQLDPELLKASPQSFLKKVRQVYGDILAEEFTQQGVTPEMVAAEFSPARAQIKDLADATDRLLSPASTPIRNAGLEVARRLGQKLSFRRAATQIEAYLNDDQVVVDESLVKTIAPSPESLKVVAGHEGGHWIGNDQVERIAYIKACQKVAASDELEALKKRKWRSQEVFADMTPQMLSPTLAKAAIRVTKRFIAQDGVGTSGEYPTNIERRDIALSSDAYHQQHQKERSRASKRSLLKEFEDLDSK